MVIDLIFRTCMIFAIKKVMCSKETWSERELSISQYNFWHTRFVLINLQVY